jgi:hypothetical protein
VRRSNLAIYVAAWLGVIAVYAMAFVAAGAPLGASVRNALAQLVPDAALGLAVLELPRARARGARAVGLHAAAAAAFLGAALAGWMVLVVVDGLIVDGQFRLSLEMRGVSLTLLTDGLFYGILVGVAYARHNGERAANAEALRARATLEALRAQLNPHFLLNTFHALLGLVRRDPALAETAIERLGDLLRYSLRVHRDSVDEVPLRDEWAFVDSYLELERLRLGDRLRVDADVPGAVLDYLVPTFAVQTLVENSVRHAIAQRAAGGLLQIRVSHADGRLRVAVEDDGSGETARGSGDGAGVGLRLLRDRVAALYGGAATLGIHTAATGTRADLELPARHAMEDR